MILVLLLEKSEIGISYSFEDLNADQKQEKSALVEDLEVRLLVSVGIGIFTDRLLKSLISYSMVSLNSSRGIK